MQILSQVLIVLIAFLTKAQFFLKLSNSAIIGLLSSFKFGGGLEFGSWCILIEKNHTLLNLDILVVIHCHRKDLLHCFEKRDWLYTLRLYPDAWVHHPVSTRVSETVHLEIDVETIKLIKERFPYLLPPNTNFQSH